jgi:hypothetical protein
MNTQPVIDQHQQMRKKRSGSPYDMSMTTQTSSCSTTKVHTSAPTPHAFATALITGNSAYRGANAPMLTTNVREERALKDSIDDSKQRDDDTDPGRREAQPAEGDRCRKVKRLECAERNVQHREHAVVGDREEHARGEELPERDLSVVGAVRRGHPFGRGAAQLATRKRRKTVGCGRIRPARTVLSCGAFLLLLNRGIFHTASIALLVQGLICLSVSAHSCQTDGRRTSLNTKSASRNANPEYAAETRDGKKYGYFFQNGLVNTVGNRS